MDLTDLKKITYDFKCPLDEVLIAYRTVAKKSKSSLLLNWITKELNGYEKNEIPPYRFVKNQTLKYIVEKENSSKTVRGIISKKSELSKVILNDKHGKTEVIELSRDHSNLGLDCGIAELQFKADKKNFHKSDLILYIDHEVEYKSNNSELGYEQINTTIAAEIDFGKLTTVVNNIRIILQDFIDELEKIENWEDNPLTSILIDKTFTFNININNITNNITNRIDSGDGNIINNGNDNVATISNNEVIHQCLDIVEAIKTNNEALENLKLSILVALSECQKEKINSKSKILQRISAMIVTSTAVLADAATAMPLFTPLFNYLKG